MRRAGTLVLVTFLCLLPSVPSLARRVVGRTQAVFHWAPASGPVAGYVVYVSRDGGPFVRSEGSPVAASARSAVVRGAVGETLRVRVAPVDASGAEGPPSPVSEAARFVAGTAPSRTPSARDLVGRKRAVFEWEPSSGSVAGYAVHVSRNGGPFRREGSLVATDVRRAVIRGDFGETVRVRVAAVAPSGSAGPLSEPSEAVVFLEPAVAGGATSPEPPGEGTEALVWGGGGSGTPRGWSHRVSLSSRPTQVGLSGHIEEPVVIAGPPTLRGSDEGVIQLREVTRYGFRAAFREWAHLDGGHTEESAPFLVLPAGHGTLPGGVQWEAGRLSLRGRRGWRRQRFESAFDGRPGVFLTLQSSNGAAPVAVRARAVDATGFEAALFPEEAHRGAVPRETVGYVALHVPAGSGRLSGRAGELPFLLRRLAVSSQPTPLLGSALHLEEDRSSDDERTHGPELLDLFALGPHVFAQDVSSRSPDPVSVRRLAPPEGAGFEWGTVPAVDDRWQTVPFGSAFEDPILVVGSPGWSDAEPVLARVRNVGSHGFEVRLEEWEYQDGVHGAETLRYLVAERGIHALGERLMIEASSVETDALLREGGTPVSFGWDFTGAPAVFTGITTRNGAQPVVSRVLGRGADGFRVALQEEEALAASGHRRERVDWIAIQTGWAQATPDRRVRIDSTSAHSGWMRRFPLVPGAPGPSSPLTALAGVVSAAGHNPVSPRVVRTGSVVRVHLQEEQSLDPELYHQAEDLVLFVAD